ncbi:MAG: allophanate hydrolase [Burkholderiaceae bacterium]
MSPVSDLSQLPFDRHSLHQAYQGGASAEQVIQEVFRRIATVDDPGIFIDLFDPAEVIAQVDKIGNFAPEEMPLWGLPFVVKDNIDAAGHDTTAACPAYAYAAPQDAFVVDRLKQAGALLIGKTNLDQFATGLVGVRSPYQVPLNAIDPAVVPGGSSSGSAVSVAHGLVCFSLGTDTAGSGRVPAALNNIVGLKPSLGLLSASGVVPACRTLDTVSIFALNVADAVSVLTVAGVYDADDDYARDFAPVQGSNVLAADEPVSWRLGIPDSNSLDFAGDEHQRDSFTASLERLKGLGAEIVPIDFKPFYDIAQMLYAGTWVAERYSVIESMLRCKPDQIHPVTRQIITQAERYSATDAFRDQYQLKHLSRRCEWLMRGLNGLCVPSTPDFCFVTELETDPIGPNNRMGRYTNFVNLLDMCGIAVPVARRIDNRPGSVTLLAGKGKDTALAKLAETLQHQCGESPGATNWPLPPLSALPSGNAPQAQEFAIAVVGAHLSGMPLNGDLTERGAKLVRATRTASNYRLYALAGGPPARPGLVQSDDGSSIEIEIWALPKSQVASFLATIPRPLGIGTLALDDGGTCHGFICEPAGLTGATDVTEFGGWRAYLANRTPTDETA